MAASGAAARKPINERREERLGLFIVRLPYHDSGSSEEFVGESAGVSPPAPGVGFAPCDPANAKTKPILYGISILDFRISFNISQTAIVCSCEPHSSSGSGFRPPQDGAPALRAKSQIPNPSFQCLPQTRLRPPRPGPPDFAGVTAPPATSTSPPAALRSAGPCSQTTAARGGPRPASTSSSGRA